MLHYHMCVFRFSNVYEIAASLRWRVKIKNYYLQIPCPPSTLWSNKDLGLYFSLSFHFHFVRSWLLKGCIANLKSKQWKKYSSSFALYMNAKTPGERARLLSVLLTRGLLSPNFLHIFQGLLRLKSSGPASSTMAQLAGMTHDTGTGCFSRCPHQKE